jgi:uncharacterized protein YcfL
MRQILLILLIFLLTGCAGNNKQLLEARKKPILC